MPGLDVRQVELPARVDHAALELSTSPVLTAVSPKKRHLAVIDCMNRANELAPMVSSSPAPGRRISCGRAGLDQGIDRLAGQRRGVCGPQPPRKISTSFANPRRMQEPL